MVVSSCNLCVHATIKNIHHGFVRCFAEHARQSVNERHECKYPFVRSVTLKFFSTILENPCYLTRKTTANECVTLDRAVVCETPEFL